MQKSSDNILSIEGANNTKLFYRFIPAVLVSNFAPLIIILQDEENTQLDNFEYKMWNILIPINNFEHEEENLLQKLIQQTAQEYECEDHVYLYSNATDSYSTILLGISSKANAVYANVANIQELNTNALHTIIKTRDSFPIFYLCNNEGKIEDKVSSFLNICKENTIQVHLDFCSNSQENEISNVKKVLDMFSHVLKN